MAPHRATAYSQGRLVAPQRYTDLRISRVRKGQVALRQLLSLLARQVGDLQGEVEVATCVSGLWQLTVVDGRARAAATAAHITGLDDDADDVNGRTRRQ